MTQANAINYSPSVGGMIQTKHSFRQDIAAAIVTGQISGLIMAVVMMAVFTIFIGKGPLYPVQVIGSFVFGDQALQGFQLPAFMTGLVLHQFGPALFWSLVFGGAVYTLNVRGGVGLWTLGVAIGLLSQFIDVNLIMPAAMRALHGHDIWAEQVPAFWSWAAHLVYGLGLSLYPRIYNRVARHFA